MLHITSGLKDIQYNNHDSEKATRQTTLCSDDCVSL